MSTLSLTLFVVINTVLLLVYPLENVSRLASHKSNLESVFSEPSDDSVLNSLAFITGHWRGEMKGGVIEEDWSAAEGDNMIGMFRLVKEGEGVFYEFMTIEAAGEKPVLRIRHFSQGLVAWEEKENISEYPLVELSGTKAAFENEDSGTRLTYERSAPDALTISLEKSKDGKKTSTVFSFHRMP